MAGSRPEQLIKNESKLTRTSNRCNRAHAIVVLVILVLNSVNMSPYYVLYVLLDPCPVCDMETSCIFGFTKDHRETKNTAQK